ncbi:hypothetical protein [Phenylobacterium sp.]|jgi:hypothetical protein|uniref:hypothetical protein n=1 Tax=Phenylobacterium sp. TaxID=1871053 RepID=UPI002F412746
MPDIDPDGGFEDQDRAETFDETNYDDDDAGEVAELRTFEELPDVMDVTQALGDSDDDEGLALDAGEYDPDDLDPDLLEDDDDRIAPDMLAADETDLTDEQQAFDDDILDGDDNIDGLDEVADADLVSGGEDDFTNFQSKGVSDPDLKRMGYSDASGKAKPDG